jgi:hypothetical protein
MSSSGGGSGGGAVAAEEAVVMVVAVIEKVMVARDTEGSRRRNSWILRPLKVGLRTLVVSAGGGLLDDYLVSVRYWGVPKRAPKEPGGFRGRLCRRRTRTCNPPLLALNTGTP